MRFAIAHTADSCLICVRVYNTQYNYNGRRYCTRPQWAINSTLIYCNYGQWQFQATRFNCSSSKYTGIHVDHCAFYVWKFIFIARRVQSLFLFASFGLWLRAVDNNCDNAGCGVTAVEQIKQLPHLSLWKCIYIAIECSQCKPMGTLFDERMMYLNRFQSRWPRSVNTHSICRIWNRRRTTNLNGEDLDLDIEL